MARERTSQRPFSSRKSVLDRGDRRTVAAEVVTVTQDVRDGIDAEVPPSGPGCVECEEAGGWWVHLRRCAQCGHVGCCDSSPSQHATAHYRETGHPVMRSYEPGEEWFWDYRTEDTFAGPTLAPPLSHPADQPAPGPAGRVPEDWRDLIHR